MSKYKVNSIKPSSPMKRYEFLRERGVVLTTDASGGPGPVLKGKELDEKIDEIQWRIKHPGQEPIREFSDGLPSE